MRGLARTKLYPFLQRLNGDKLFIADVGSTGSVEERWQPLIELCHFYTFDPDPRAKKWNIPATNFPIGLWSESCHKTLHLKQYPPASSLFETNDKELEGFGFEEPFKTVGIKEIALNSLDQVLKDKPLDFLKIDAEGAELEILKGAENLLENVLGLQLEVFFMPVRKQAPLFGDIEQYMRKKGFFTYQLAREHWIRKNKTHSHKSGAQLIWGNALFLPSKEKLIEKLQDEHRFLKFILILCAYQLFDFAYELCQEREEHLLCQLIKDFCKVSPFFAGKLLFSLMLGSGKYLLSFSSETKAKRAAYLKRKVREMGTFCLCLGKNNFAVYDE